MRHTLTATVLTLFVLAASPTAARADAGPGALRLSVDVPVLAIQVYPDAPGFGGFTLFPELVVQFGLWTSNQFLGRQFSTGFAYQVNDALVIGTRAGFGIIVVDTGAGSSAEFGLVGLIPFLEYMFGEGNVRPFIGAEFGFHVFFPEGSDASAGLVAGGIGGVHLFAASGFSISPMLILDFVYLAERNGCCDAAGFQAIFALGFEGWITGSASGGGGPAPGGPATY